MKLIGVNLELDYQNKRILGNTLLKKFRNLFHHIECDKLTMGTFFNFHAICNWFDMGYIDVYLASLSENVEKYNMINGRHYKDLDDYMKVISYEIALTQVITHEHLHYIFADFGMDMSLTTEQQHKAIKKLGFWW